MKYDVKVKINGVEVIQNINADVEVSTPYISELKLKSSTSLKGLDIGSTASDSIYFTMYNPFKPYFDGDKVELFILENYEDEQGKDSELAEEVGSTRTTDVYDSLDIETEVNYTEEDEEEEEITDTATITALTNETNAITASVLDMIDGDSETTETTTTTGEVEGWQKLGTYYVVSAKLSDDNSIVSIEAHDGFSKLNIKYEPANITCTIQQAYDDFRAKVLSEFKIVVDEMDLSEYDTKTFNFKGRYTYRTFLGYIAGMLGGFATFGLDDTLGISYYNFSDKILLSDELIDFQDTAGGGITIDSIVCDRATSIFKQDLISTDDNPESDGDIIFYNPYVDQDLLNEIFEDLHGISYTGGKATAMWSPALESGSFLRIMDDEEYKNYLQLRNELSANTSMTTAKKNELKANIVGIGKTILITNQTISFAGDAITQIDSVLPSVYKKEAQIMSPNDAKFEHLYAEMIEADYIDAVKVVTEALIAKNAEIQDLVVQSINGHSIKNTYILAKALSDEALLTAYGIQTFYTAIDPRESHDVKEGDLWWKTVIGDDESEEKILFEYRDGEWKDTPLDAKTFRANSITAQELNVKDLAALNATIAGWEITDNKLTKTFKTLTEKFVTELTEEGFSFTRYFRVNGGWIDDPDADDIVTISSWITKDSISISGYIDGETKNVVVTPEEIIIGGNDMIYGECGYSEMKRDQIVSDTIAQRRGLVAHCYGNALQSISADTQYHPLNLHTTFSSAYGNGFFSEVSGSQVQLKCNKPGTYLFTVRYQVRCGTANRMFTLTPYVNGARYAAQECSYVATTDGSSHWATHNVIVVLQLEEGNTVDFRCQSVAGVAGYAQIFDCQIFTI